MLDPKRSIAATVLATLILTFAVLSSVSADVQKVYGKAFNQDGKLEYIEEHVLKYENGKIVAIETTFYDAGAQEIARQVSDFSHGAQFGSFDFIDQRHRINNGARVMPDRILIYSQKNPQTETDKKYLPRKSDQIVGQGFYQYVAANLDALARGQSLSAKLVLPAQMGQYDVRISKQRIQGNRIQLVVELNNWFMRLFAPNVEVEYEMDTRRLMWYRGVSMVSNKEDKNVEVVTTYDYSQQPSMLGLRTKPREISSKLN
jgi:hypothetical protein